MSTPGCALPVCCRSWWTSCLRCARRWAPAVRWAAWWRAACGRPAGRTARASSPRWRRGRAALGVACGAYRAGVIPPMAAVAGAVAQEILAGYARDGMARAWVNNGGDIATHLAPGASASVGICSDIAALDAAQLRNGLLPDGQLRIRSAMPVRGVATSGWRGRSQSLGIADSVTVLARTAAEADAAATIVANAVDVPDERIGRMPAWQVRADSDLGALPVTVAVPALPAGQVRHALRQGLEKAQRLQSDGLLWWALLVCQRQWVATAAPAMAAQPSVAAAPFLAPPPPSIAAAPARSLHPPLHRSLP